MIYKDYAYMENFKTKLVDIRKEFTETGCPYTKDRNDSCVNFQESLRKEPYCKNCALSEDLTYYDEDGNPVKISICEFLDSLDI
jgi:hypothetical protein